MKVTSNYCLYISELKIWVSTNYLKIKKKKKTWIRVLVTYLGRDLHWCAINAWMVVGRGMRRGKQLPGQSPQVQTASFFGPRQMWRCHHFLWVSWHEYRKWEALERYPLEIQRWLDSITNAMNMNFSKLQETVKDREMWCAAVHGVTKSQTRLSNRVTTIY